MDPRNDEQTELLRGIWNEIKELGKNLGSRIDQTNAKLEQTRNELSARIHQTNERIDQTNERLEELRDELSTRITQSEIHTATAITDLVGTLGEMKTLFSDRLDLRGRVARCEHDIEDIKQRLGA
jgi:predicted  nucleic acid-binding Zn-ribbon protein